MQTYDGGDDENGRYFNERGGERNSNQRVE